jgi:hypothetical protein
MAGAWYNGYSPKEREAKFKVLKRKIAVGEIAPASGPCALCGDPEVQVEYHSEDYSEPYLWEPPAVLTLCEECHRRKLHQRFRRPAVWQVFLAHVRRGGYARELGDPRIKKELRKARVALERGERVALDQLRPYDRISGSEWFATLRMDAESLTDPKARPRP